MDEQPILKSRKSAKSEPEIECWDDDQDLQGLDNLQLIRNISTTTVSSGTHGSGTSHHRDSISSRLSIRSDVESNGAGEEDWQLLLPADDEASTNKAIASAKQAGVPIPANVPASALLGGTIKRLGGRKLKKVLGDDYWMEDLEIPKPGEGTLKLKRKDAQQFPDTLRQISMAGMTPSATKPQQPAQQPAQQPVSFMERLQLSAKASANRVLDKYRENDDDGFADIPTITVAKGRATVKTMEDTYSPIKPNKKPKSIENLDDDFQFPADDQPLKLAGSPNVRILPRPDMNDGFSSFESAESNYGRTRKSPRSSSISALSPSVFSPSQSSLTAESEDDLDGLVLPDGPLRFKQTVKERVQTDEPELPSPEAHKASVHPVLKHVEEESDRKEDFFQGIDIGDGDVFDTGKLTLNRNIKHKTVRQISPVRRTAMTLTFTNKSQPGVTTRIPKPQAHERPRSKLEPVSESGGPIPSYRRSQSRLGHSTQSSVSSIPTPSTPSFPPGPSAPSTPSRRGLNGRGSRETMRTDPTTTSAQLLKAQRSMPAIRNQPSPARAHSGHNRPQSRSENTRSDSNGSRAAASARPKTPTERSETSLGMTRKASVPFLPAGTSQSHHITAKTSRSFHHRPDSSDSNENAPLNRPISRLSNPNYRPNTPTGRRNVAPAHLVREASMKTTLTKPKKRRVFGDGSELEVFDDLPTSASIESKFVKRPIPQGTIKASNLRNKLTTSSNPSTTSLNRYDSAPQTPLSPQKPEGVLNANVPRFARGTTASQAREQRNALVTNPSINATQPPSRTLDPTLPFNPLSLNRQAHLSAKPTASPLRPATHHQKPRAVPSKDSIRKPQLITSLGASDPKTMKGMSWNPTLLRWEGNENALATFDAYGPETSPPRSATGWASGTNTTSGTGGTCKPALIANVGGSIKGVQVVGGMVFDPSQMRWLRMAPSSTTAGNRARQQSEGSGNGAMTPETGDEEEDVFAGLEDLEDGLSSSRNRKKNKEKYSVEEGS